MKQGVTFDQLLTKIEHTAKQRQDYYLPSNKMYLQTQGSDSMLITPCGEFSVRDISHQHLAELSGIEKRYYQRMRDESPELLDHNVNHWLQANQAQRRILRALEPFEATQPQPADKRSGRVSQARAIVSPRYAILDNDGLLSAIEPVIANQGLTVESCELTDEKLTLKMVSARTTHEVQVGDPVQFGIMISNSEVRSAAINITWFVKRLVCLNGLILPGPYGRVVSRRHVGRDWSLLRHAKGRTAPLNAESAATTQALQSQNSHYGVLLKGEERRNWENGIWDNLRETLSERLHASNVTALFERLQATTALRSDITPQEITERIGQRYQLSVQEQMAVLQQLEMGDGVTLWNLLNSVTRIANDAPSYSRATDLEQIGGFLANLSEREWGHLTSLN